jgi:hypothetical protein
MRRLVKEVCEFIFCEGSPTVRHYVKISDIYPATLWRGSEQKKPVIRQNERHSYAFYASSIRKSSNRIILNSSGDWDIMPERNGFSIL